MNSITLDHHVYDDICDTWRKRRSDPQPVIELDIQFDPADMGDLGFRVNKSTPSKTPPVSYSSLPDTGCQSCLSGTNLLSRLNIHQASLISVVMRMNAANEKGINLLGALPLRITGTSPTGSLHTTRQLVYFTDSTNKLFLSKQACASLGIISKQFPTIGEALGTTDTLCITHI